MSKIPPPAAGPPGPEGDDALLPVGAGEASTAQRDGGATDKKESGNEPSPQWSEIDGPWPFFGYLLSSEERFVRALRVLRYLATTVVIVTIVVTLVLVLVPQAHAASTAGAAMAGISIISVGTAWLRRRRRAIATASVNTRKQKPKKA